MKLSAMQSRRLLLIMLCGGLVGCSPAIPPREEPPLRPFTVSRFGAKGDGHAIDTAAINKAIAAANAAGGGTVYFPAGTYLASSIHLQNNVTLYLESGSVIESADHHLAPADAPETRPKIQDQYQDFGHSHFHNSLIWGEQLHNIGIVGPGLIKGTGLESGVNPHYDKSKGEKEYGSISEGAGDKAIALRECSNVTLRDFSILHGGWFAILATGVNTLTIDNLKLDTNRDGMDIDACSNVRVTNTSVNSPWDDGICLKASYALGRAQACENVTISNCFLSGNFDEGTLIDGTFKRSTADYKSFRTGRIKLGTESNGDFKNIAVTNCVFDDCRGIAIESVDGSHIEDVSISNITMRHVANSPLFIRLGSRLRGPKEGTSVGTIRRINVSNIIASGIGRDLATIIAGIPDHPIEDVRLSNLQLSFEGGGTEAQATRTLSEKEKDYPEPGMFGPTPAYGVFVRHARNIELSHVNVETVAADHRPPFFFADVAGIDLLFSKWTKSVEDISLQLREVYELRVMGCPNLSDQHVARTPDAHL